MRSRRISLKIHWQVIYYRARSPCDPLVHPSPGSLRFFSFFSSFLFFPFVSFFLPSRKQFGFAFGPAFCSNVPGGRQSIVRPLSLKLNRPLPVYEQLPTLRGMLNLFQTLPALCVTGPKPDSRRRGRGSFITFRSLQFHEGKSWIWHGRLLYKQSTSSSHDRQKREIALNTLERVSARVVQFFA